MSSCEYRIEIQNLYDGMPTPPEALLNKVTKGTIAYIEPTGIEAKISCNLGSNCPISDKLRTIPEATRTYNGTVSRDKHRSDLSTDMQAFLRRNCPNYK